MLRILAFSFIARQRSILAWSRDPARKDWVISDRHKSTSFYFILINHSTRMYRKKNRPYNHPSTIFEKIDRLSPFGETIDESRCYGKFPKTFGWACHWQWWMLRPAYKARWFNEAVKSSRLLSAGSWGHPRDHQLRERGPIRFNVSASERSTLVRPRDRFCYSFLLLQSAFCTAHPKLRLFPLQSIFKLIQSEIRLTNKKCKN